MARAKKYEVSDMDLIKAYQGDDPIESKAALHQMWDRYAALRNKMKFELIEVCMRNKFRMQSFIDEYDSRAWEKFLNAMNSIRPADSAHIKNWKFYIQLWGYWRSMNRDMIHEYIKDNKAKSLIYYNSEDEEEVSILDKFAAEQYESNSTENEFDQDMKKKIFWKSIDNLKTKLTSKQKIMLAYKNKGNGKGDICKLLKISGSVYDQNLSMIKRLLVQSLMEESKNCKYEVGYGDYL